MLCGGGMSGEDFVKLIHSCGARGMEVVDIDFEDASYEHMRQLQEIGRAHGVEITCMSLEHDLCREDAAAREADVQKVMAWMDLSRRLGINKVRVFTGWKKNGVPYDIQVAWVHEGLEKIARYAVETNMTLVLENHNSVCLRADEILEMFDIIHSPRLFTCPDIFNYKKTGDLDIPIIDDACFDEIEKLLPLAKNAHIKICEAVKDNTEDKYLDIGRMLGRLKAHGYDGPVTLEFMWPYQVVGCDLRKALTDAIKVLDHQMKRLQGD